MGLYFYLCVGCLHFSEFPQKFAYRCSFGNFLFRVSADGWVAVCEIPPFLKKSSANFTKNLNFGPPKASTLMESHLYPIVEVEIENFGKPNLEDSLYEFHLDVLCLGANAMADSAGKLFQLAHKFALHAPKNSLLPSCLGCSFSFWFQILILSTP